MCRKTSDTILTWPVCSGRIELPRRPCTSRLPRCALPQYLEGVLENLTQPHVLARIGESSLTFHMAQRALESDLEEAVGGICHRDRSTLYTHIDRRRKGQGNQVVGRRVAPRLDPCAIVHLKLSLDTRACRRTAGVSRGPDLARSSEFQAMKGLPAGDFGSDMDALPSVRK